MSDKQSLKDRLIRWLHRIAFCKLGYHDLGPVYNYAPNGTQICDMCGFSTD